jgi:hypothetical protein
VVSTTPRPLYPRERPGTHCTGGWVGRRTGVDVCEKSRPHRDSIPEPTNPQPVAVSSYINVPTGLRPTGHAAPYQATGPTPTPPSPIKQSAHNFQPANSYKCTQLTPKTASVVPPEDGSLTPETCSGLTFWHRNLAFKF